MAQWRIHSAQEVASLRLLIDTNIFITAEPYSGALESNIQTVTSLLRLAAEQGHRVFLHPASRDDLLKGTDPLRRGQRLAEFERYLLLEESPIPIALAAAAGDSDEGTNDHRDLRILASLNARAVTHLVTNDRRMLHRAYRAGLADGVYTPQEALEQLRALVPAEASPPPSVDRIMAYTLDVDQQIFVSLREDYSEFDKWLDTVRAESRLRPCFVVRQGSVYAGLALLKHETDCEYRLCDPVLKISTFKVDEHFSGSKYGELLLKAIFSYANSKGAATLYLEVFERHDSLKLLLAEFGFVEQAALTTKRGENVFVKQLLGTRDTTIGALIYHKMYGPPALLLDQKAWVIPIMPRWHKQLFPDAPEVPGAQPFIPGLVGPDPKPWGNALRKAYLCRSTVKAMEPGDAVLFYRSRDLRAITTVGVVEDVRRTHHSLELFSYVGRRTVYSPDDITHMCSKGEVLAILFRQDRFLDPPWRLAEVVGKKLLQTWPQSVTEVKKEGMEWLRRVLAEE
jgi:GNAT superfamily N-acetyltransferase